MDKTQIFVLVSAVLLFIVVLNLVRLRRLREEYSWLWLATAFFYLVMAIKPKLILPVSDLFGITNAITTFTFFGLLFIVLILIHYSVVLSRLSTQVKNIAQYIALLDGEQYKIKRRIVIEMDEAQEVQSETESEDSLPDNVTEVTLPV